MYKVYGIEKVAHMAEAEKKVRELNKRAYDKLVEKYVEEGIDKELAKVMAKVDIEYKIA